MANIANRFTPKGIPMKNTHLVLSLLSLLTFGSMNANPVQNALRESTAKQISDLDPSNRTLQCVIANLDGYFQVPESGSDYINHFMENDPFMYHDKMLKTIFPLILNKWKEAIEKAQLLTLEALNESHYTTYTAGCMMMLYDFRVSQLDFEVRGDTHRKFIPNYDKRLAGYKALLYEALCTCYELYKQSVTLQKEYYQLWGYNLTSNLQLALEKFYPQLYILLRFSKYSKVSLLGGVVEIPLPNFEASPETLFPEVVNRDFTNLLSKRKLLNMVDERKNKKLKKTYIIKTHVSVLPFG